MPNRRDERSRPGKLSGDDLTAYGMLMGGDTGSDIVNAVAAHGADRAAQQRSRDYRKWTEKVAATEGLWRKLKVIIIG